MTEIYITENSNVYGKLLEVSSRHIPHKTPILRTKRGKPYFKDNPLYFSISHSANTAVFAISSSPVGIDAEIIKKREYALITARFSERERREILNLNDFYTHWTIKECIIKIYDLPLTCYKQIEYFNENVYLYGKKLNLNVYTEIKDGFALSVCGESSDKIIIKKI